LKGVVLQVSEVERISQIRCFNGRNVFLHEWLDLRLNQWRGCCPPINVEFGIGKIPAICQRYGQIGEIVVQKSSERYRQLRRREH